jgi:hypothetical protein
MDAELLHRAVQNNAAWCDAVCRANAVETQVLEAGGLWHSRSKAPRFYPDAIAVADGAFARLQKDAIARHVDGQRENWSAKDSYQALDLTSLGARALFSADWIVREPGQSLPQGNDLTCEIAESDTDLIAWESRWASGDDGHAARLFQSGLLTEAGISVVSVRHNGEHIGGGILNLAADVAGFSNVYSMSPDMALQVWTGLLAFSESLYPSTPVVGYEQGEELDLAFSLGFRSLGQLTVWLKA